MRSLETASSSSMLSTSVFIFWRILGVSIAFAYINALLYTKDKLKYLHVFYLYSVIPLSQ